MDGHPGGSQAPDEDDDESSKLYVFLSHVAFFALWYGVGKICRRFYPAATVPDEDKAAVPQAKLEELQQKKSLYTAYTLWLMCGWFGAHHFYLDRTLHGVVCVWSLNFCGLGWLLDGILMPYHVRAFNGHRTAAMAGGDGSYRRLCCRLPLGYFLVILLPVATFVYLPRVLHYTGAIDIDRFKAQTEVNPYELLGISPRATMAEAKAAYRKESLRWHPDRNVDCGKVCENKMSEISKAYDLIKSNLAPHPEERTWEAWINGIGNDWMLILNKYAKDT
eukprot:TRINITY_DN23413_c0_g3_i1.p1 TRINITY_DN23413_c0_g3~~TRINITY_DN23413_c0_g3_i1.p1  ORF type:complete len:277 (+),score=57.01 TRINITY_DN23413_c0_g3_i1:229-1059(+)